MIRTSNSEQCWFDTDLPYVYPYLVDDTRNRANFPSLRKGTLSTKTYYRCYALPAKDCITDGGESCTGGGLCCDGTWIPDSGLNLHDFMPYDFDTEKVDYVDEDVVYIGRMSSIWGHAITDGIKHLWWFLTEDYRKNHSWKKICYWGKKEVSGNFLQLIQLAGVDIGKLFFVDRNLQFRSIIVPDSSFVNDCNGDIYYYREYVESIDNIIGNCLKKSSSYSKIFLSQHADKRNWNIGQIEKMAKAAGYKVVYPEEHTVQEQISLLWSANEIMTFESSVGHNIVFCHPGARVAILRKANYINNYQMALNIIRKFDVSIIDVHLSAMNFEGCPYGGPFFVYANEFVSKYLNCRLLPFPWRELKKYVRYNLYVDSESHLAKKLAIPDGYVEIIAREITRTSDAVKERLVKVFRFVPMPSKIRALVVRKIHQYIIRHLF